MERNVDARGGKNSRFGVGMEKLDRDAFSYHGKIEKIGELGVKWIRLNSGWEKTEKREGIYDFSWLDEIVDSIIQNGMEPWICLGYGNPLYCEQAKEVFEALVVLRFFPSAKSARGITIARQ